jgi:hypothetical protein
VPPTDFNPDRIAALLNQQAAPQPTPAADPREARLGVTGGTQTAALTQSELDALTRRIYGCWNLTGLAYADPAEMRTVIQFRLNRDGTVAGQPIVVEAPAGQFFQAAPERAIQAIYRCAPYTELPPEKYDGPQGWNEIRMNFTPIDMGVR